MSCPVCAQDFCSCSDSKPTQEHSGFKLGDIITAYHKGYWRLTHIQRRFITQSDIDRYGCYKGRTVGEELKPLFTYELVMDSKFSIPKSKKPRTQSCDSSYCQKVNPELMKAISLEQHDAFCEGCDKLATFIK